jgi:3-deoxy-manno-octulosonate cytidylyltransferase (CMP-KDO synthetase)
LSIISFTPGSLKLFANNQVSRLEKIEGIELLRAIDLGMKIKTKLLKGDSFSVDVKSDYLKAKKRMQFDNVAKIYNKN